MGGENEKILMDCILKCIMPRRNIIIKIENIKSIWQDVNINRTNMGEKNGKTENVWVFK